MSAHVLLNSLNKLGKRDKMPGLRYMICIIILLPDTIVDFERLT